MKWIMLIPVVLLVTACGCYTNTIEYQQVNVSPVVARPVYYDTLTMIDPKPVDVTATIIQYY